MSDYELPETRLGTTDETGERVYVHPHDVKGKWTSRRKVIYWFLIFIYLILPWVYINGKQLVLLNLPAREFRFFGTTFYGHDGPFLVFLILAFVFFIAFVTSVWGRVWCGYACPQTVFIDAVFRTIERFIEGSGPKRDKLQRGPWNKEKFFKRSVKWALYILVSMHIVHSGIGYFVGTHKLLYITTQSPLSNLSLFILMLTLTLIILIDFAWFREQFCIIACPYGRFQSIVMDENSLVVAYDKERGEPRKRTAGVEPKDLGDCVGCNRCVNVCPTGIDIRDGLQMECIACTMCIDACDDIMRKVGKEENLIRYSTENQDRGIKKSRGPRVYIYFLLLISTTVGLFTSLTSRENLKAQFIRETGAPYQLIASENKIVNHFKIKFRYQNETELKLILKTNVPGIEIINSQEVISLKKTNETTDIFIKFSTSFLKQGEKVISVIFYDELEKKNVLVKEVRLVGPITTGL